MTTVDARAQVLMAVLYNYHLANATKQTELSTAYSQAHLLLSLF